MGSYDYTYSKINGLNELTSLRKPSSKTFLKPDGKFAYLAHCKPVHYFEPGTGALRTIDLTLIDDGTNYITTKSQASIGFRKDKNPGKMLGLRHNNDSGSQFELTPSYITSGGFDYTIPSKFKSISVDNENYRVYHTFTHDYGCLFTQLHESWVRHGLRVDVPITTDASFELRYTVDITGYTLVNGTDGEGNVIPTSDGEFVFEKDGATGEFLRITPPKVWTDTEFCPHHPDHTLTFIGGVYTYTKYSTPEVQEWLLERKDYPPFYIDSDVTYYAHTDDGYIYGRAVNNWTGARELETGNSADSANNYEWSATRVDSSNDIYRSFFYFDTSGLGSGATVSSATFSLYGYGGDNGHIAVQEGTQGTGSLTTADYDSFNYLDSGEYGHTTSSWNTSGYNDVSLNSTGLTNINVTGNTFYCAREYDHDYLDVDPLTSYYQCGCYYANETGTSKDPKLYIEYSTGATYTKTTSSSITLETSNTQTTPTSITIQSTSLEKSTVSSITLETTGELDIVSSIHITSLGEITTTASITLQETHTLSTITSITVTGTNTTTTITSISLYIEYSTLAISSITLSEKNIITTTGSITLETTPTRETDTSITLQGTQTLSTITSITLYTTLAPYTTASITLQTSTTVTTVSSIHLYDNAEIIIRVKSPVLDFDGGDYVTITDADSLDLTTDITLEIEINPDINNTSIKNLFDKNNAYRFILGDGGSTDYPVFQVYIDGAWRTVKLDETIPLDTWSHLTGTYSSTTQTLSIYLDGELKNTTVLSGLGSYTISSNSNDLVLGYGFDGSMKYARIYNTCLTATQIKRNSQGNINYNDIVGWWDMTEGTGSTLYNKKDSDSLSGTVTGATWTWDTWTLNASSWSIVRNRGSSFDTATFNLSPVYMDYRTGDEIQLYNNTTGATIWSGFLQHRGRIGSDGLVTLEANGLGSDIAYKKVTLDLSSKSPEYILTQALSQLAGTKGRTYTLSTPVASGITIASYSIDDTFSRVMGEMIDRTGYTLRWDTDYTVYFEPAGNSSSGCSIDSSTIGTIFTEWIQDNPESLINRVSVDGEGYVDSEWENYNGSYSHDASIAMYGEHYLHVKVDYLSSDAEAGDLAEMLIRVDPTPGGMVTVPFSHLTWSDICNKTITISDELRQINGTYTVYSQTINSDGTTQLTVGKDPETYWIDRARERNAIGAERARIISSATGGASGDVSGTSGSTGLSKGGGVSSAGLGVGGGVDTTGLTAPGGVSYETTTNYQAGSLSYVGYSGGVNGGNWNVSGATGGLIGTPEDHYHSISSAAVLNSGHTHAIDWYLGSPGTYVQNVSHDHGDNIYVSPTSHGHSDDYYVNPSSHPHSDDIYINPSSHPHDIDIVDGVDVDVTVTDLTRKDR